jgi:cyclic beta-1,2-glucan synthetase
VSTVDSGNLAVSLVTLAEGCRELAESPVFPDALWSGLTDALDLLSEALADRPGEAGDRLRAQMDRIAARAAELAAAPVPSPAALDALRAGELAALKPLLLEALETSGPADGPGLETVQVWLERSEHHLEMMRSELDALLPWLSLAEGAPAGLEGVPRRLAALLGPDQPLRGAASRVSEVRHDVAEARGGADAAGRDWLDRLDAALVAGGTAQDDLLRDIEGVAARAAHAADAMDFAMLYDRERRIFNIGYNLNADQLDPHHYDLLMSEARLASYFAIAKRDVPAEHWFHLGRPISGVAGELTALSWNGSMFEFLMPALVLGSQEGRLTGRSEHAVVAVQRRYADQLGCPGGCRNPPSRCATAPRPTSTRPSACRAWGCGGGWARTTSWRPTPAASPLPWRRSRRCGTCAACRRWGWRAPTGCSRRSISRPNGSARARASRRSTASWRTTRA